MPDLRQRLAALDPRLLDRRLLAGAVAAVLVVLVVVLAVVCGGDGPTAIPTPTATPTPTNTPTPTPKPTPPPTEPTLLDGVLVYKKDLERLNKRLPLAVIIDNHVEARPPEGLASAELVYEAIAEGGITRFMAVYWRQDIERIAPVRSARVYYLDWAKELDAVFIHHGRATSAGPADVTSAIARLGIRNLDGFYLDGAVDFRDPNRPAPHDAWTSTELLWSTAEQFGFVGPPAIEPWLFKDDEPKRFDDPSFRQAKTVDISFGGSGEYSVQWKWDRKSNTYLRSQGGRAHGDADGRRIGAHNVVVQFVTMRSAGDGTAHLLFDTIGPGSSVVFRDGVAAEGTWRKDSAGSRTRFYNAEGKEIAFNRGNTWVEIVPAGYQVGY